MEKIGEMWHGSIETLPNGWKCEPVSRDMYLVGSMASDGPWEVVGLFTTLDKAIEACVTGMHFIGCIEPDVACNEPAKHWPRTWFPKAEDRPEWAR